MPIISLPDVLEWEATQQPALTPTLRKSFDCGEASLNIFLSNHARQADEENTARTWVNLDQNQKKILGYIALRQWSKFSLRSRLKNVPIFSLRDHLSVRASTCLHLILCCDAGFIQRANDSIRGSVAPRTSRQN